jgi:hemerythrin superfamily protein
MELLMDAKDKDDTAAEHSTPAITVLTDDHNRVRALFRYFAQLEGPGPTRERMNVVEEICKELVIHSTIEEELFYPAARKIIDGKELINEAEVEHGTAKFLIRQLLATNLNDGHFCAKVKVLREYVKHHMDEEEKEMFPKVKHARADLSALEQQMIARREVLREMLKTTENIVGFEPVKYFVGRDRR